MACLRITFCGMNRKGVTTTAEYIEKEALIKEIRFVQSLCSTESEWLHGYLSGLGAVIDVIVDADAADVAPVRHAKWEIVVGSNGKNYMVCTDCRVSQDLTGVFTYCPNCGAKMDLEE